MTTSAPLPILWRDEHLVALHKPPGWLVHRTGLDADESRVVLQALRDQIGRHVYPVHRLDKGTSGVLLMALNSEVAGRLGGAWHEGAVRKLYVAMVRGWASEATTVDHPLVPDESPEGTPAQPARTHIRRLARLSLPIPVDRYDTTRVSLVQAEPETGRRHQIRRHLKHLSYPLIGDATHGKGAHNRWWAERLGVQRLWLHAAELALSHPMTGQPMRFHSPWHPDHPDAAVLNPDWAALIRSEAWQWGD
ncbi:pseudouridine synthase [Aquabacterium olei]|uniref:tRNA pseudouridine synthase C n=1 Tax=Aquabacterium olei TaxID=1296669 RepID=A0A2U8FS28_9BURK|nr:pseudouridine synthase [Aquabacterium olei]AWI53687.1 pseudouridine synthase [Aquabacterium olei]